jgi:hypothetical protein
MEASGMAVEQRVVREGKISGRKMPEVQKVYLGTCRVLQQAPGAPIEAPQRGPSGRQLCAVQDKEIS